ncbi:MAG: SPOR domain-containing protein [Bauldia sp.]
MTDRYKATSGVRAVPDSHATAKDFDLDQALGREDPLVELARIVAGRPPADSGASRRTLRPIPSPGPDLTGELEAELMGGLKSAATVTPLRKADPANDWPSPAVPGLDEAAPPPAAESKAARPDFGGLNLRRGESDKRVLPLKPREAKTGRAEIEPAAAPIRSEVKAAPRSDLPIRGPRPVAPGKAREAARDVEPREERRDPGRLPAGLGWAANDDDGLAAAVYSTDSAPSPRSTDVKNAPPEGRAPLEDPVEAFFRQMPEGGAFSAGRDTQAVPAVGDDFLAPYASGGPNAANQAATAGDDTDLAAAFAAIEPVPGYGPAASEPEVAGAPGRKRLMLGVSALVVALLVGGGVVVAYQFKNSGPLGSPPVIAADARQTRAPAPPTNRAENAPDGKSITDRVGDGLQVVTVRPAPSTGLPQVGGASLGSREIDGIIGTNGANTGPFAAGDAKPVRTVNIDPSGTPVTSGQSRLGPAAIPPGEALAPLAGQPLASPAPGAAGTAAPPRGLANTALATPVVPLAPTPVAPTSPATAVAGTVAGAQTSPPGGGTTRNFVDPAAVTSPTQASAGQRLPGTQATVTVPRGNPVETLAPTPAPPRSPPQNAVAQSPSTVARGAEGFVVQVTSQKTESAALATFKDLQKRYPNFLSDKQPDIQEAEIAGKGTFFRVRVGPVSTRDAAVTLCEGLKGAGADCIVVRN